MNTSPPPQHPTLYQVLEQAHVALQQQSIGLKCIADRAYMDARRAQKDATDA